jgi:hypothetical protein
VRLAARDQAPLVLSDMTQAFNCRLARHYFIIRRLWRVLK